MIQVATRASASASSSASEPWAPASASASCARKLSRIGAARQPEMMNGAPGQGVPALLGLIDAVLHHRCRPRHAVCIRQSVRPEVIHRAGHQVKPRNHESVTPDMNINFNAADAAQLAFFVFILFVVHDEVRLAALDAGNRRRGQKQIADGLAAG